ncbi:ectonucleoside triphosphate diphosphohydrolase 1 [Galendromus occidentalis]|uniref:Ectonucleoside triphosphate diphosphohydrolase 1 n=1 Tax=Galendromus occidentalis TaxID=34638 RepID=A0AAJ6W0K5_9ACAR|nr:ectonucleoside triphosphate diphosphohydrolase 1 [Galendromus occidentalis]
MPSTIQQKVENRLGDGGTSVFNLAEDARIDALLGACGERFGLPVDGTIALYSAEGSLLDGSSRLRDVVKPDGIIHLREKSRKPSSLVLFIAESDDDLLLGHSWLSWSVLSFLVSISGIVLTSCVFALSKHKNAFDMGVVIDAGSTHSEAVIFKWPLPKTNGTAKPMEVETLRSRKKSISSLSPEEANTEFTNLLGQAERILAENTDKESVLYMSATDGMRLLRMQNPDRANAIIGSVREAMKDSGLNYKAAEISDGADESAQKWVSVNHEKNRLSTYQPTFGALDLGETSTHITVEVKEEADATRSLELYGKQYHLLSKDYLCFGLDELYKRYLMAITTSRNVFDKANFTISSPCHSRGFSSKIRVGQFLSPCVLSDKTPAGIEDLVNRTVFVTGAWHPGACRGIVASLLDAQQCRGENYKFCFDPIDATLPMDVQYIASSGFFSATNEAKIKISDGLAVLRNVSMTFCNQPYDEWLEKYFEGKANDAAQGCFKINVVRSILVDKYGFTEQGYRNLQIPQKNGGQSISWHMGFMINASNALPEEEDDGSELTLGAFLSLVMFFTLEMFVSFALFCLHRQAGLRKEETRLSPL